MTDKIFIWFVFFWFLSMTIIAFISILLSHIYGSGYPNRINQVSKTYYEDNCLDEGGKRR